MRTRLALFVSGCLLASWIHASAARADAVLDWNIQANATINSTGPAAHAAVLSLAIVHGAIYDAVNAIAGGYQPYLVAPAADLSYSQDAAAATAAFRVLLALVPAQATPLQARYDLSLAAIPDGPGKAGGIEVGETAAAAMLAARANDGRGGPFTFVFGTEPGEWRKAPPLFQVDPAPWVGNVTPFLVPSAEVLRSDGPDALTSNEYAEDFNEVKSLGSLTSTRRTADQTMAAIFWQAQPGVLYGGVMRALSARYGLTTAQNARLFAMASLAAADGAIGCWNDKYYWNFWRPIDAIHEATADGNPATETDPAGSRCSTPRQPPHPRSPRRPFRTTRPATAVSAAGRCTRCRTSSARTGSHSTS